MRTPFLLLKYTGKALLNILGGGIAGDLLFDALPEIAKEVWDSWSKEQNEEQRRVEVQLIAQAAVEDVRQQVADIRKEFGANRSPEIDLMLESYLTQVPAMVRKSLRRPSDPSGTTVSIGLVPQKADDLLAFLPSKFPHFKQGEHPLVGVDWELEELLGVGGFGEVWKAGNPYMTSVPPVALKFCLNAATAKILRNEAAILDRVMRQGKHPGIVQLQHTYLRSETPCLEYEYIEGGDLVRLIQEWHRSEKKPKPEQVAKVILQLAEIVEFAHRLTPPLVHRDLKPSNILLLKQPSGKCQLKIADFGIGGVAAHQAVQQSRLGISRGAFLTTAVRGSYTPLYASPQQMRGETPDPRDDVFALGVIWYQLLIGDLTSGRPGGTRWHERLLEQDMPPGMVALLAACFEDRVEDRPINAVSLAGDLTQLLTTNSVRQRAVAALSEAALPTATETLAVKEGARPKTAAVEAKPSRKRSGNGKTLAANNSKDSGNTAAPDNCTGKVKTEATVKEIVDSIKADRTPAGDACWHNQKYLLSCMTILMGRRYDTSNGSPNCPEYSWNVSSWSKDKLKETIARIKEAGKLLDLKVGVSFDGETYDPKKVHVGIIVEKNTKKESVLVFAY